MPGNDDSRREPRLLREELYLVEEVVEGVLEVHPGNVSEADGELVDPYAQKVVTCHYQEPILMLEDRSTDSGK